ncbi:MAG: C_GCAxxG_C_C family protein [Calditrichaeota bacterium]|jgi:hypothetical protein|nr:C_GCAxxG_C_C family protein [Calditrichota bacterium]MBT7617547.1 C_GCAxxG_C_C family protein [Calditrichota bacterium]MBT7788521.1 C_GCAxxG_C_C family protein [Calditrichota bacterium]
MTKVKSGISRMQAMGTFLKLGTCSETVVNLLDRAFDNPLVLEENASQPLAGGIMQHGYQCGMIWGASLAAGAQAYKLYGAGPEAETRAIIASQRLVESFQVRHNTFNCLEITDIDKSSSTMKMIFVFLIKGGTIGCFRMAGWYAPIALNDIQITLSDKNIEVPSSPVSCVSLLAQKMGMSDRHAVMAAGLAGGIGLSGGGCGALGAAIWILGMKSKEETGKVDFKNPKAQDKIDEFLKSTNYKFECSEIVGRKFGSVNDHAAYVCGGGCEEIIEVLAKG